MLRSIHVHVSLANMGKQDSGHMTCHPERITSKGQETQAFQSVSHERLNSFLNRVSFGNEEKKASDHMTCHFEAPPGIPTCVPSWINIVSVMCLDQVAPRVNTHFTPWCQPSSRPLNCMGSRFVAVGVAHGIRLYTYRRHSTWKMHQDDHLEGCVGRHTRVLALYDSSDAFWHALPPHDEPTAISPPRGEEEAGYMWQVKRATFKTRRASRLFQEHMKLLVLGEAGFAALKVCYQVYYCP